MNLIRLLQGDAQPEVDLKRTYDAVVIGSGAAGGMAAHVLTSRGMKVLMLEAGKKLDINKELKSTEWPYEHPRRGDMAPGQHPLSLNEYNIRQPPYAADSKFTKVYSYVQGWNGSDYSSAEREGAAAAGRAVLRDAEVAGRARVLHVRDRHQTGDGIQGQQLPR